MWRQRKVSIMTAGLLLGSAGSIHAQVWLPALQPAFGNQAPAASTGAAPSLITQAPVIVDGNGQLQPMSSSDGYRKRHRGLDVAPFGESLATNFRTQVSNGVAARMTLYDYDFVGGTTQLNYRGVEKLRQFAALVPTNDFPIAVQATPMRPEIAEARRAAVIAAMTSVPAERIVVSAPAATPLHGTEAGLIYFNLLTQTRSVGFEPNTRVQGLSASNSGGGGSGSGSSGSR